MSRLLEDESSRIITEKTCSLINIKTSAAALKALAAGMAKTGTDHP